MYAILAERLKQCREEKGLTQGQVAIYCDITEKTYQNYELMTRTPKVSILIRLAMFYDVPINKSIKADIKEVVFAEKRLPLSFDGGRFFHFYLWFAFSRNLFRRFCIHIERNEFFKKSVSDNTTGQIKNEGFLLRISIAILI